MTQKLISALGVLLIILSFAWPNATDPNAVWSVEQQQERGEAIREVHRLSDIRHGGSDHAHAHQASPARQGATDTSRNDTLEQARARVNRSNAALQTARSGHQRTITLLKWSGIFLVAVGAIAYFAKRNTKD